MILISATIISFNEQDCIAACIQSLQRVADEVIVVDSFSTDDTVRIATALGARVVEHEFEGYGQQKNYAASIAKYDYILSLDADEVLSDELVQSLWVQKNSPSHKLYVFKRLNHFGGKAVTTSGQYPDLQRKFYNRRYAIWTEPHVHERVHPIDNAEPIMLLAGDLIHHSYVDIADFDKRGMKYAWLGSMDKRKYAKVLLAAKMLINPPLKFFRLYLAKSGIADGVLGLKISLLIAKHTFYKYYFAWVK
jgi:glycosyltransferase involved in cell wall biosynthesis